jgi:hypothetical protein
MAVFGGSRAGFLIPTQFVTKQVTKTKICEITSLVCYAVHFYSEKIADVDSKTVRSFEHVMLQREYSELRDGQITIITLWDGDFGAASNLALSNSTSRNLVLGIP